MPKFAAALVLGGGALLAVALAMPVGGVIIMLIAGLAAVLAVALGHHGEADPPAQADVPVAPAATPLYRHAQFAALLDALDFPLLIASEGRVSAANRAALALLGNFIVDADVRTAIRHPAAGDLLAIPSATLSDAPVDLIGIGGPGQRWQMRVMPLSDNAALVALQDQSAHDAVERMRADFVANASHELRTPLAVILGTLETLHDPGAADDVAVRGKFLANAEREARRMVRLVEDLLSISRIEASKGNRPTEAVDLSGLCRSVVAELTANSLGDGQSIQLDAGARHDVPGDRAQLSQLVHNLVSNALKYGGNRGPVHVRVTPSTTAMVELLVSDSGEGIAAEHLPRLTERFYRVDSARSREKGGTGLGLAIVKHIVQRHQGRLDIDSVPGEGTLVRVRLPHYTSS